MKTTILALALLSPFALVACGEPPKPLQEYRPIADAVGPTFEADLAYCRAIATAAEAQYLKRQNDEMAGRLVAGLLIGAVVGQAVGGNSDWTAYGAANGAASGAASVDTELAQGGPRRIVDRCLAGRGHRILSDAGRG